MKKYLFLFLAASPAAVAFADVVASEPTGEPSLDYALLIGGIAIAALLIVRMVRKRKQM